jgi:hypothetical protein
VAEEHEKAGLDDIWEKDKLLGITVASFSGLLGTLW